MEWATAHLSHDTMDCIVTHGWGGWAGRAAGATIRPSVPAIQPYDTARIGLRYGRPARGACAHGLARERVAIQSCIMAGV